MSTERRKSPWTLRKATDYYGFNRWGKGHFEIDKAGFVCVDPMADGRSIRVMDILEEAKEKELSTPLTIRFQDMLHHQVISLNQAFRKAIADEKYGGRYRGVFPIKVNQLREVVEEIYDAGKPFGYGIEVGSKPELMIALAIHDDNERLLICNGYKDETYIRLALLGSRLKKPVIIVAEQVSEVEQIIKISKETGSAPMIGLRAKLASAGEGKWASSSGSNAKFGLTTEEILFSINLLKKAGLNEQLKLLHFHLGSQVPNILTLKKAVTEAAHFYCQMRHLGCPMGMLDVGGGLGIDYDGSKTTFPSSMNYSMVEYARDVVFNVREICRQQGVPEPDLITESGRAVVAPHSLLIVEVTDRITKNHSLPKLPPETQKHQIINDLEHILENDKTYSRLERYHDATQKKEEAISLFNLGYLDLPNRALAESLYWQICGQIQETLDRENYIPEELAGLRTQLADQYVCNFSVFQSLMDHWAYGQLFPITPLHRLRERPTVDATLVDITCDSDGKISKFVDLEDVKETLRLHKLNDKPYYLGIYLVGAYQDIMGDLHNLFGRVDEVHVFLDNDEEDGFYIETTIEGFSAEDVFEIIQYKGSDLQRRMKRQIDQARQKNIIRPREGMNLYNFYTRQIKKGTYLNND